MEELVKNSKMLDAQIQKKIHLAPGWAKGKQGRFC
jgi:hypothetical protein